MNVGIRNFIKLSRQGVVNAHNNGPTPDLVIKLFQTKPEVWRAELLDAAQGYYSIRSLLAKENKGISLSPSDVVNAMIILGPHFSACDTIQVKIPGRILGKMATRIFLWWD